MFLAALIGGSTGMRCLLIWLRGRDDRVNAAIAGAVGGLASLLDAPARRQGVALYLLVRSVYALLHALMRRRFIVRAPHMATTLFAAANAFIMYAFIQEPHLLDRSYYNWMLRTANVTGVVISYTMRESRLGLHPGQPGVAPTPAGCSHPDPSAGTPLGMSPGGVDVLSGVIELAALLGAAAGVPAPDETDGSPVKDGALEGAPRAAELAGDDFMSYSEAINTPLDDAAVGLSEAAGMGRGGAAAAAGVALSVSAVPGPLGVGAGANAPRTTAHGSVTVVGSDGHHFGFHSTGAAARLATGVDFMSAKGWGDAQGGGRQMRPGGGGSRAVQRLYAAAEQGVDALWASAPPLPPGGAVEAAASSSAANPLPALSLSDDNRAKIWAAALPAEQRGRPVPDLAELVRRAAVLRQAPPRALLPGVQCGPSFWRSCAEVYHPGQSCAVAHASDVPALIVRCLRLYAPVHLVPLLLFRWRALLEKPAPTAARAAVAISRSTAFLTAYVTVVKAMLCLQRTERHSDAGWQAGVAGVLSGMALSLEAPQRASELMLYCLPKGIDVAFQLLERRGLVSRLPLGNVAMFSIAMAIVLALDRSDFRPAYASLLGLLFGTDQAAFNADPVAAGAAVATRGAGGLRLTERVVNAAPPAAQALRLQATDSAPLQIVEAVEEDVPEEQGDEDIERGGAGEE